MATRYRRFQRAGLIGYRPAGLWSDTRHFFRNLICWLCQPHP
jgi:hypothetical protein